MSTEQEVLNIGKKLEKMIAKRNIDHSSAADLLRALQAIRINIEALQKTKIGITVNNVRKAATNEDVISLAKSLIKSWKKLVSDSSSSTEPKGDSKRSERRDKKAVEKKRKPDTSSDEDSGEKEIESHLAIFASDTKDPVRLKCRELLCNALKPDGASPCVIDPVEFAISLEQNILKETKTTDPKYKNRVRSRIANLKDTKHPALKENVIRGLISAEKLAKMTAEEMASDAMKDLRAKYTEEAINDRQISKDDGAVSDMFACEKCGAKNCTYKQVQLLCSDEPMTTFLLCYTCGYRWSVILFYFFVHIMHQINPSFMTINSENGNSEKV